MTARSRSAITGAIMALALALPALASAHAYLIRTDPAASRVLNAPPATVQLTYDEAVEPRLAIVSVTDASGTQEVTGQPRRSPGSPDTLVVPLKPRLPQGWYLIYWRAISVDGHPVQGAFTYAVGPDPGPAPQFPVPKLSATAATAPLLTARTVLLLAVMAAIGLLAFRLVLARPLARRVEGSGLRALSGAFVVAAVVGLVAVPVYLDFSVANDRLSSVFDVGANVPLFRVTAFGRAIVDLWLCFALFVAAGLVCLWVDRPERERRSVAELAAGGGAALAAAAVLLVPPAAGHAAQTSPRGLTSALDVLHLAGASIWLGGLVAVLVVWAALPSGGRLAGLRAVIPAFSNVALASVIVLAATGTGQAIDHMPAVSALWQTGYGRAILVKAALLLVAIAIASGHVRRTKPALVAGGERASAGGLLLRTLVRGELVVVAGIVFASALLSSLPPPPPAFALASSALASVGPGRVARTITHGQYRLELLVTPNKAAAPDDFALRLTRGGVPVRGATVTLTLNHTQMQMPQQTYSLAESSPGVYARPNNSALVMVGRWALDYEVTPPGGTPFNALILDEAEG